MNNSVWITVKGVVQKGHQVASGKSRSSQYADSSIKIQKPFFKQLGLDLVDFYDGTLNISIEPYCFTMKNPEFTFFNVEWTSLHPPEHFSFSSCKLLFEGIEFNGWIYYPHPETKKSHFQNPSILEIIAPPISNIKYGDEIQILINKNEVSLKEKT
ncbi:MAG: hypothetical protein ACTS2F_21445 [Thainema sp.]